MQCGAASISPLDEYVAGKGVCVHRIYQHLAWGAWWRGPTPCGCIDTWLSFSASVSDFLTSRGTSVLLELTEVCTHIYKCAYACVKQKGVRMCVRARVHM